jgi:hypothetical protein
MNDSFRTQEKSMEKDFIGILLEEDKGDFFCLWYAEGGIEIVSDSVDQNLRVLNKLDNQKNHVDIISNDQGSAAFILVYETTDHHTVKEIKDLAFNQLKERYLPPPPGKNKSLKKKK